MKPKLNLNELSGGALVEKLDIEMRKLAENVLDPNTPAEVARTITVTIKIKPNEQRQVGNADISVKSSLAPSKGIPTSFVFDYDKEGNAVVAELVTGDRNQLIINNDGDVADDTGLKVVGGTSTGTTNTRGFR
ncbi:replication terminator protein [Paenibacillus sp. 598K]|uniref:replication terminator protein n=1 Tax=Paenibacillus sp. 598K TaxID=1117987 RepID=UPI000FFED528|nr:replication terminator protein [Paenibacillus sp. 598K]